MPDNLLLTKSSKSEAEKIPFEDVDMQQPEDDEVVMLKPYESTSEKSDSDDEYAEVELEMVVLPSWDDLKNPLVELLLKFYNAEDFGQDFVFALRHVIKVLYGWRQYGDIDA